MDMDSQHGYRYSYAVVHAAWIYIMDMQHGQAAWTSSMNMQHGYTYIMDMQNGDRS
jgi:hypothetical protein